MPATVRGEAGEIRWRYYIAAKLARFTVSRATPGGKWALVATVVESDAFKLTQRPLTFVVPRATGEAWYWPIASYTLHESGRLTATLDPPFD